MITIQTDVWRSDQICFISVDEDELTLSVTVLKAAETFVYEYEDENKLKNDAALIVSKWKSDCEKMGIF